MPSFVPLDVWAFLQANTALLVGGRAASAGPAFPARTRPRLMAALPVTADARVPMDARAQAATVTTPQ